VIDHLARIGAAGPITESDVKALCALSRHRQVRVKVSAFYALGAKKPPHLDLAPLVKRVYEAFGPQRLMWASDCPFQVVGETYEDSISLVRDHLDFLSAEDNEWILRRSAEDLFFR
jgi:predicted TIM-barrel fold metal-dependent hydrolase